MRHVDNPIPAIMWEFEDSDKIFLILMSLVIFRFNAETFHCQTKPNNTTEESKKQRTNAWCWYSKVSETQNKNKEHAIGKYGGILKFRDLKS